MEFFSTWINKFSKKNISDYSFDEVVKITSSEYSKYLPIKRHNSLLIISHYPEKELFEIVLQKALIAKGDTADFSLRRYSNLQNALKDFELLSSTVPIICQQIPHCDREMLQELVNYILKNPDQKLIHIYSHFGFNDCLINELQRTSVNLISTNSHKTPLHIAIANNQSLILSTLIKHNPDFTLKDRENNNIFHYAAQTKEEIIFDICNAIPKQASLELINSINNRGYTPLQIACENDKPNCVKALLKNDAIIDYNKVNNYSTKTGDKQFNRMVDKLNVSEIKSGGSILHCAHSIECMEIFLGKCDINAVNFNNETALHLNVRRKNLDCVVWLLSHDIEINIQDRLKGNTALHEAVITGYVPIIKTLIVFGADLNIENHNGETARHIASTHGLENLPLLIHILHLSGANRCKAIMTNCNDGCSFYSTFDGYSSSNDPFSRITSLYEDYFIPILNKAKQKEKIKSSENQEQIFPIKLLSLDGGGIKGLVMIQMLSILEKRIKRPLHKSFDWIAGTSTGGMLALLLGTGKSAHQCRCIYFRLKDKIFSGKRPYESSILEKLLKEEIGSETKMTDIISPRVMVTATIADRTPVQLKIFRNYCLPTQLENEYEDERIWVAARSSGAAPTYFSPYGKYLDGGLISNNPTLDALTEITQINCWNKLAGIPLKFDLELIVSLGTGIRPSKEKEVIDLSTGFKVLDLTGKIYNFLDLLTLLIEQATQCDGQVVERAKAWCYSINIPYLRLNPPLSKDIALDEKNNEELISILWETTVYIFNRKEELEDLIKLLE